MDADFNAAGELVAGSDAKVSAGAFRATADGLSGTIRGRVLPACRPAKTSSRSS